MGSTVEIDISLRPPSGTKVWLSLTSCTGTASAWSDPETLPWKLDTTALQKSADSTESCCEGVAPSRRCSVGLASEYETRTPIVGNTFAASSEVRTLHHLTAHRSLRL